MRGKKGLSEIVATLLIVTLTITAVVAVGIYVNSMVKKQLNESGSCFEVRDKLKINDKYTCYDRAGSKLNFFVEVGDVEIEKIVISISTQDESKGFDISSGNFPSYLAVQGDSALELSYPAKGEGKGYVIDLSAMGISSIPDGIISLKAIPVVNGNTCTDSSDVYNNIQGC